MTNLKSVQQIVSVLLIILLFLSVFPFGAFASELQEETEETTQSAETEETADTTPTKESVAATEESSETTEPPQESTVSEESTEPETEQTEAYAEQVTVSSQIIIPGGESISMFALSEIEATHYTAAVIWYDGVKVDFENGQAAADAMYIHQVKLSDGTRVPAFCIEPGVNPGTGYTGDENAWEALDDNTQKALGTLLMYGAPNCFTANMALERKLEYHVATQVMVHEIVCGFRDNTAPYTCRDDRVFKALLGGNHDISADNNGTEYYNLSFDWIYEWDADAYTAAYDDLSAKMAKHDQIPSFASRTAGGAPTYEMTYSNGAYSLTLTDTNGVLSSGQFKGVAGNGLSYSISGNTLTITADASVSGTVSCGWNGASGFRKDVPSVDNQTYLLWSSGTRQKLVQNYDFDGSPTPLYFNVKAEAKGTATMKKTTTASNGDVEGFCFKIYRWGGTSWYGKTDANGNVYLTDANYNASTKTYTFDGLTDGDYTFLEVLSKKGAGNVFPNSWNIKVTNANGTVVYNKTFTTEISRDENGDARLGVNTAKIPITGLNGGGRMTMTINNAPLTGDLKIIKTSSSGNVAGFNFKVEGNGISKTVQSGADGTIRVDGLAEGTYKVTEVLSADSPYYCASTNPQTVTVQVGKLATVTFNNELKKWQVTVTKRDAETGTAQADASLDGAVYGLYKDGTLVKRYTVKNGTFTTDSYLCGTGYALNEISAPSGYQLDTDVYNLDDYSAAGKCTGPLTASQVTVLEDVIKGYFQITKRTKNPVSGATAAEVGAVFRYYLKSAGSYDACAAAYKGSLTTGTGGVGKSKALPYGTYVVEQTEMLVGTDKIDPFEVTISQHGKIYEYTKDDPFWTGTVSIVKYEAGTTTPLKARFNLLDSNRTVLESGTTGTDGKLSFTTKLVYGLTYYIQETEAPDGYVLNDMQHPISVTQRNQAITLTLYNKPEEGSISIKKVDVQGNPMAGVKFCLEYSTDGIIWSPVVSRKTGTDITLGGCTSPNLNDGILTTDKNGAAAFTGLRISGQGSKVYYRLSEVSTENGSTMLLEPAFEGELPYNNSKDITVTAVNTSSFELPHTGSSELLILNLSQILCGICCLALMVVRKKEQ